MAANTGDALDALVGRAWRDDLPWEFLTALTEIGNRSAGTPGERRAAALLVDAFGRAGADTEPTIEPFRMRRWKRGSASLSVRVSGHTSGGGDRRGEHDNDVDSDGDDSDFERGDPTATGAEGDRDRFGRDEAVERSFETYALPYSPAGEVRGTLVDVNDGAPETIDAADLDGKVAITGTSTPAGRRYVHRMETFGHAVAGGAVGVIFANHVPGQLPPTGSLRFDLEARTPGVGVSAETGAWLREYAGRNGTAVLDVEARTEDGTGHNVVASVGPDTDEAVVALAHYDAHDVAEGALDNGCGIAVLVAATRLLAGLDLDRKVVIVATSGEELGLVGANALANDLDLDRVKAVVNVDGAGRFRDLRAITHGSADLAAVTTRVVEQAGQPLVLDESPHSYSDHWPFLRAGVPTVQFHSERPGSSGQWERGWTHTRADTRDKVDPRDLREHAICVSLVIRALASQDVRIDRISPETTRKRLREAGAEPGMRAAGVWPAEW